MAEKNLFAPDAEAPDPFATERPLTLERPGKLFDSTSTTVSASDSFATANDDCDDLDLVRSGDLDAFGRPRFYADHLVHHGCTKNEYYEYKASARTLCEIGCMMEHLGCVGTQAVGDCNIRPWNGEGSCTRGNYPCIACTAPEFEEPGHVFTETPTIAGIPVGLPSDMPKAWFMALASLSKAATPKRIDTNAHSDRIRVAPSPKGRK